jgi:hypothetical protein
MKRKPPAWLSELEIGDRLLAHLISAQSRYESAILSRFGARWSAKQIRAALRELQDKKLIDLAEFDRVRWSISPSGRNHLRRVRVAAERKTKAAA